MRGPRGLAPGVAMAAALGACAAPRTQDPVPPQVIQAVPRDSAVAASRPLRIALLLPLTGPYAEAADHVQNGFVGARFDDPGDGEFRIFDTAATPEGTMAAYGAAIAEGVDLIVGPVTRENVRLASAEFRDDVPVVALNYIGRVSRAGFYQFGLAPEDEARQAARSAYRGGGRSSIVMVSATDWGRRIAEAFVDEFTVLGGVVRELAYFSEAQTDFAESIKESFGIVRSERRHDALEAALGAPVRFEPRVRDDFDVVFVGATADTSRMLIPQLSFHNVRRMPIYGTARLYDGQLQSRHRDGLRFCEAPIVLEVAGANADLRERFRAAFQAKDPESLRMQALGYDAYRLARSLLAGGSGPGLAGATGWLEPGADGVISRRLECVEIAGGELRPLPDPVVPQPPGPSS